MKWTRIRAGWYETANEVEGAYVLSSDAPGSWIVSRWTADEFGEVDALDLRFVESTGTLADAKFLAEFDARLGAVK